MRKIILLGGIALMIFSCSDEKKTTPVLSAADTIAVKLIPIGSDTSNNILHISGSLSTEQIANLSFKVGGIIENIYVKEGDRVKKGQLLATLKSAEIDAQVQQASLAFEKAQRDYQRTLNLYRDSVATLEQMQNAKTGADIAQQSLQQVQFNRQHAKIFAPADGFIVQKKLNAGELASVGTAVIAMNMSSSSSKWILKAGVSDQEWALIETGNKAKVSVDAYPSKTFNAVVTRKGLAADAASGSFLVELQVNFGNEQPAVGMFGTATITPSTPTVGVTIPYDALVEADGRKGFVFVTSDRRTVKKVSVDIASVNEGSVTISGGLEGHSFVVTSGSPYLNDQSIITTL